MCSRLAAALLVVVLAIALLPGSPKASPSQCEFTDAEETAMEAAFARLVEAQIIPMIKPNPSVFPWFTRAEFSAYLVRSLGLEAAAKQLTESNPFPDTQRHWASGYVTVLYKQGIVQGDPGGTFRPDDWITLPEVKLMLARTLRAGNDLTLETADEALINSGVDPTVPCSHVNPAQRGVVVLLLDRTLSVPLYARSTVQP